MFSDENYFLERLAQLMMEMGRFDEAADAYEILFRSEPMNADCLSAFVEALKQAGNFVKLDDLRARLVKTGLMIISESQFDWKSQLSSIVTGSMDEMAVDCSSSNQLPTLTLPMRDINWSVYAHILHSMATGCYSAVFKKAHFDPSNYAILAGPCVIELNSNSHSQVQTQTQSLLLSSVQEYLTSSMEDVSNGNGESQSKRRLPTRNKRESKTSAPTKCELSPADFIKNVSVLLGVGESQVVEALCSTEQVAIQLLDKDNVSAGPLDNNAGQASFDLFTSESLLRLIESDNQEQKSISQRIFELLRYFFIDGLGHAFPSALSQNVFSLCQLFHLNILSFDNLKSVLEGDFVKYCLGVAELTFELTPSCQQCYELLFVQTTEPLDEPDASRLKILTALFSPDKVAALETLHISAAAPIILTRFYKSLPHLVTEQTLIDLLGSFEQVSRLEEAELLLAKGASSDEIADKLGSDCSLASLFGTNRLRLGRLLLRNGAQLDVESVQLIVAELFSSYAAVDLGFFTELIGLLVQLPSASGTLPLLELICLFWNLFSRRQLIPTTQVSALSSSFARLLQVAVEQHPSCQLEVFTFLLNWLAQEKSFGSCQALVPLSIFHLLCQRDYDDDFSCQLTAYSIAFSLWRFTSIFTAATSTEHGLEDWDRHPVGTRECPSLAVSFSDLNLLCNLIWRLIETADNGKVDTPLAINDPSAVACIDWLKEAFCRLPRDTLYLHEFGRAFEINRSQISHYLTCPLDLHASAAIQRPKYFTVTGLQSLRVLLNFRSDLVHAELQGRKKSLEVLKTIRSDLKTSLSIHANDAEVWSLLGTCYYDALVHYLSSEAEFMIAQQGKLKRTLKKAILCFQQSLRLDQENLEAWAKLSDLCDWAMHYPSQLAPAQSDACVWICSVGCRAVKHLLPRIAARDLWQQFLRLELFLRRSGRERNQVKLMGLLKQAVIAAARSYCENVYESTALYTSLAKIYARIAKCGNEHVISKTLDELAEHLPPVVKPKPPRTDDAVETLLAHLDALNVLDRKRIFHAHVMTSAWLCWRLKQDPHAATAYLSTIFPFLKPNKRVAQSLCLVYQSDHDRPARFLSCTRRYLLRLFSFITDSGAAAFADKLDLLATVLKKLHYVRKTILGFSELLLAGTEAYFKVADQELANPGCSNRQQVLDICNELLESLEEVNVRVPPDLFEILAKHEGVESGVGNVSESAVGNVSGINSTIECANNEINCAVESANTEINCANECANDTIGTTITYQTTERQQQIDDPMSNDKSLQHLEPMEQ